MVLHGRVCLCLLCFVWGHKLLCGIGGCRLGKCITVAITIVVIIIIVIVIIIMYVRRICMYLSVFTPSTVYLIVRRKTYLDLRIVNVWRLLLYRRLVIEKIHFDNFCVVFIGGCDFITEKCLHLWHFYVGMAFEIVIRPHGYCNNK